MTTHLQSASKALFTGSMNPFTRGHRYVVDAALAVFDHVVIGIGENPDKRPPGIFTIEQRIRMVQASVSEYGDRVTVTTYTDVSIDYAMAIGARAIIRGIRNGTDHAYEASMTHANGLMARYEHDRFVPTLYVQCPPELTEISATRIRELIQLRRDPQVLAHYVLPPVVELIEQEIYAAGNPEDDGA